MWLEVDHSARFRAFSLIPGVSVTSEMPKIGQNVRLRGKEYISIYLAYLTGDILLEKAIITYHRYNCRNIR